MQILSYLPSTSLARVSETSRVLHAVVTHSDSVGSVLSPFSSQSRSLRVMAVVVRHCMAQMEPARQYLGWEIWSQRLSGFV